MSSFEKDLYISLIGIVLFIFRNPHKKLLFPISFFVLGLFISQVVYNFAEFPGQIVWAASALGLLTTYSVRLKSRQENEFLVFSKVICMLLLAFYPLPFYEIVFGGEYTFWFQSRSLVFGIIATVYIYDRWILKPGKMKKKFVVILVAQTILILVMLVFALYQKAEADLQRETAVRSAMQANQAEREAQKALMQAEAKYRECLEARDEKSN